MSIQTEKRAIEELYNNITVDDYILCKSLSVEFNHIAKAMKFLTSDYNQVIEW